MSRTAGRLVASAVSGLVAGGTGVHFWERRAGDAADTSQDEAEIITSSPRALTLPVVGSTSEPVASDFIKPFVSRYGYPDLDQVMLPSEEYTSCWDTRTRNARWVVERVNLNTVSGPAERRKASFKADSRLNPTLRSNLSDYTGSGFDRGHLAPAGDHKTTLRDLKETFLLSNMSPQTPGFNRGYWADFEDFVRELVMPDSAVKPADPTALSPPFKNVYVVTGPLFLPSKESSQGSQADDDVDADGSGIVEVPKSSSGDPADDKWVVKYDIIGNPMQAVGVPTHFFKMIVAEPYPLPPDSSDDPSSENTTFVAAFAMPNTKIPNATDLRKYLVPISALECVAGMRFLSAASGVGALDDDLIVSLDKEAMIERKKAGFPALPSEWGESRGQGGIGRRAQQQRKGAALLSAGTKEKRLFRHLCTTASCVGL